MDDFLSTQFPTVKPIIPIQLAPGEQDPRLKQLSYSSNLLKHECPRKFQLYKLNSQVAVKSENVDETVTFGFGHAVGEGIQRLLEGTPLATVIFQTFLRWNGDILYTDIKRNKSLWLAIFALQKFSHLRSSGFLSDYELVYSESNKPAVELGFRLHLPKGYKYRGYVDVVLRNIRTGEVLVLEIKTSSGNVIHNSYKNSAQAIGYSVVLDWLFPELSSYQVLYLVYKTKEYEYEPVPYTKTYLQRALWIQELLLEVEVQEVYEKVGVYPMHGESCVSKFYKECEYLNLCTLSTERLTKPLTQETLNKLAEEKYDVEIDIQDLIQVQLDKEVKIQDSSQSTIYIQGKDDVIV